MQYLKERYKQGTFQKFFLRNENFEGEGGYNNKKSWYTVLL